VDDEEREAAGLGIRRKIMGDEYVDRSLAAADEFTSDLQAYLNRSVWGGVWSRPGLDHRTRSLLTLALLTALGKPAELAVHTHGALRNGCTPEEIKEVLLHAAIYAGIPAAVEAFRAAAPVIAQAG
jgi:4-carboxymuconolactone decarboxylase